MLRFIEVNADEGLSRGPAEDVGKEVLVRFAGCGEVKTGLKGNVTISRGIQGGIDRACLGKKLVKPEGAAGCSGRHSSVIPRSRC